jgi:hypothetical protein
MNHTVQSDDELIAVLERTMREVARLAPDMRVDEPNDRRWLATAAAAAVVVAGAAGVGIAISHREDPVAVAPSAPLPSVPSGSEAMIEPTIDTAPEHQAPTVDDHLPPIAIPPEFPAQVPLPANVDDPTTMTNNDVPVGWQFFDRGGSIDDVARCIEYSATFDDTWASTPITDEAASVLYAAYRSNDAWRVGIYCTEDGSFLVQVMPVPVAPRGLPGTAELH